MQSIDALSVIVQVWLHQASLYSHHLYGCDYTGKFIIGTGVVVGENLFYLVGCDPLKSPFHEYWSVWPSINTQNRKILQPKLQNIFE